MIDSGVNADHPHISKLAGGIRISPSGIEEGDATDVLGHGTAVMAAIQEIAPEADYFAIKVFHSALRTSSETLLIAMRWAIDHQMDIVNLSLGTRRQQSAATFQDVVAEGQQKGITFVAALEADSEPCLPGSLPGVFGVRIDWLLPRTHYRYEEVNGHTVFITSGYPRSLPGVRRERNLQGISFAVANMTGFIARACEYQTSHGSRSFSDLEKALKNNTPNWPVP